MPDTAPLVKAQDAAYRIASQRHLPARQPAGNSPAAQQWW
jgi:hypothetical protein